MRSSTECGTFWSLRARKARGVLWKGFAPMSLLRNSVLAVVMGGGLVPVQPFAADAAGAFASAQYKKALWMTTRYFGAIRSGNGPNWAIQETDFPVSFVKDSYKGNDVSGGWFDCGDHVMFGQTQFYAAYILAKSFAGWKNGFIDSYSGDYTDYKASKNYSMEGGSPNGLQDILEELRYEADFFVKITFSSSDFVYQKGEGGPDHTWWFHSGKMSTRLKSEGGEKDGSRKIFGAADMSDGSMPGQCAAMLAIMARVDPDADRRATYLAHAKNAYAFAKTRTTTAAAPGGFYGANKSALDAHLNAATELWLTTGESAYKTEAMTIANNSAFQFNSGWRLDYENDEPIAMLNAKYVLGVDLGSSNERNIVKWLTDIWASAPTGITTKNEGGFPLRGLSGYAFMTALYAAMTGDRSHDQFVFNQLDYMLGANSSNQSYLVGWDEGNKKMPTKPHIRNYYLNEDSLKNTPGAVMADAAHTKYLGAMIGGSLSGTYSDDITNLSMNEPCAELNAPVVASLGYMVSRVAPVDTSKFGGGTGTVSRYPVGRLTVRRTVDAFEFRAPAGQVLSEVKVLDASGREVWSTSRASSEVGWVAPKSGLYVVHAKAGSDRFSASAVMP